MSRNRLFLVTILTAGLTTPVPSAVQAQAGKPATIRGYVLDSACAFIKDLNKPVSPECARACAKGGSPLVILADDGTIYWPISGSVPATGQNDQLMKFAGKKVSATGSVFKKGGSRALVIEKIEGLSSGE